MPLHPTLWPAAETPLAERENGLRTLAEGELRAILKGHHAWLASGWNTGQRADLAHVDLHQADLRGAPLMLVDLHGADLRGADLRDADLESADLRGVNLRMSDLRSACLKWADLADADLRRANLEGADADEANLRDADLRGANLRGANLRDVMSLTPPQLDTAYGDAQTMLPADLSLAMDAAGDKLSCVLLPIKPRR